MPMQCFYTIKQCSKRKTEIAVTSPKDMKSNWTVQKGEQFCKITQNCCKKQYRTVTFPKSQIVMRSASKLSDIPKKWYDEM